MSSNGPAAFPRLCTWGRHHRCSGRAPKRNLTVGSGQIYLRVKFGFPSHGNVHCHSCSQSRPAPQDPTSPQHPCPAAPRGAGCTDTFPRWGGCGWVNWVNLGSSTLPAILWCLVRVESSEGMAALSTCFHKILEKLNMPENPAATYGRY